MATTNPLLNRQRLRLMLVLWLMLASLYTLTYSGGIETGDTRRLFDAVSSFVDYGDQYIDLAAWQFPPQQFDLQSAYPLQGANIEPMQIFAAAPLYALAKIVPGIGLAHTTYLFNIFIGALIGCVLFLYVLALGYGERTAVLASVVFGVGTAIFPYTKSFFREPLMMLCLLVAGLCFERLRANGYRSLPLMIGGTLALLALTLTKASGLLALPALVVIAMPSLRGHMRRLIIVFGAIALLLVALFIVLGEFDLIPGLSSRYDVLRRLSAASGGYLPIALHSYLLSVGGSIWGTSPIVLLAIPGAWMFLRRGQGRYPLAAGLLLGGFAFGYALLNGVHWFGGLSWPPRFLIPILPFLLIAALPALSWLARHPRSLWILPVMLLFAYSVWVQISGVALPWGNYTFGLPPEAGNLIEWGGGLNQIEYLRWVIIPHLWTFLPLDNAWAHIDLPQMAWGFGALALACLMWLFWQVTQSPRTVPRNRSLWLLPLGFVLIYGLMVFGGLRLLYDRDLRYLANDESLWTILPTIERETDADDVVLLSTPHYEPFFLNYYKGGDSARVITLPLQPGEQVSEQQSPLLRSDDADALLTSETTRLLHTLALTRERLWVLVEFGPDLFWSTRPVERFMSTHYYPVAYPEPSTPLVRLVEYSTISAPDAFAFRGAEQLTDLVYDDVIELAGFTLPLGTDYGAGDVLPVSLYWQTRAPLPSDYTIALYLSRTASPPSTQSDLQPGGGFSPTRFWRLGVPVWDHRGLQLPPDLAAGEYELWVKVYDNPGGSPPRDLTVKGSETLDSTIGILPIRINVSSR